MTPPMTETREAVARGIYDVALTMTGDPLAVLLHESDFIDGSKPLADQLDDVREVCREIADAALAALKSGSRFSVDGVEMMVVPVEPTPEMRAAGRDMLRDLSVEQLCTSDAADTYRAMLRACEEK